MGQVIYHLLALTASLNALPAVNFTVFAAAIWIRAAPFCTICRTSRT